MARILVLTEETELIKEVGNTNLRDHPIEIDTFANTLDFLEDFQKYHARLAILDIDLLRDQIFKMMKFLRSIKKDCQIILILSKENMPLCSRALSFGVSSYFIKPVSIVNASRIICSVLNLPIHDHRNQNHDILNSQ